VIILLIPLPYRSAETPALISSDAETVSAERVTPTCTDDKTATNQTFYLLSSSADYGYHCLKGE